MLTVVGLVLAGTGRGALAGLNFGGGTRSSRFRVGIGMTRRPGDCASGAVEVEEGGTTGAGDPRGGFMGLASASPGDRVSAERDPGGGTLKLGSFRFRISPRMSPQRNRGAGADDPIPVPSYITYGS